MASLKTDEIFDKWRKNMDEIRRTCLGKYLNGRNEFDLTKVVPIYSGHLDCSKQFNYLVETNQCTPCSEVSSLHDSDNKKIIKLETGKNKECEIVLEESILTKNPFGLYKEITFDFNKLSNKLSPIKEFQNVIKNERTFKIFSNNDSEISHRLVISELSNFFFFVETSILSCHICNTVKLIKWYEKDNGSIKTKINSPYDAFSIFSQIVLPLCEGAYSNGKIELKYLNISEKEFILEIDKLKLKLSKKVRLDPNSEAYFVGKDYLGKYTKIIGLNKTNINYEDLKFVPVDIHIGEHQEKFYFTGIPVLKEFAKIACVVVKPTEQLFEFEEKTSIAPYKHIHIYMWLICLLCESNFYKNFAIQHREFLQIFFFDDELDNILLETQKWHSREGPNYEELKRLAINIGFSMKFNIFSKISNYISKVAQQV